MGSANIHPSVSVNSSLLKSDRRAAGYTQAAFSAACGSVSLATVRRAEQGHRVIEASLRTMAATLGQPVERYILSEEQHPGDTHAVSLAGEWTGFFIEADRGTAPYVVNDELTLRQDGTRANGEFTTTNLTDPRTERLIQGTVSTNVLTGATAIDGWPPPSGLSTFTLAATRNNDWMDGYVAWFDPDSHHIETSRLIYVRRSSPHYTRYVAEAERMMQQETRIFRLRNLVESGYSLDAAITMLAAIP